MKVTDYYYKIEGEYMVFYPIIEIIEPVDITEKKVFSIINTFRVNFKLLQSLADCVFEQGLLDSTIFEDKILKEIESIRNEIKSLKDRSAN